MTIIGVIAATMVTVLKPQQYKAQSFLTLKQKTYIALDEAVQSILQDCTKNLNLANTYRNCDRPQGLTSTDDEDYNVIFQTTLPLYLRGTSGGYSDATVVGINVTSNKSFKMRNGACVYQSSYTGVLFPYISM